MESIAQFSKIRDVFCMKQPTMQSGANLARKLVGQLLLEVLNVYLHCKWSDVSTVEDTLIEKQTEGSMQKRRNFNT